jgi:hypothetical protein
MSLDYGQRPLSMALCCAPSPNDLDFQFWPINLCCALPRRTSTQTTGVGSRPTKASAKGGRDTRFCSQVSRPLLALTCCKATREPPTFDFQFWPMGLCCAKDTFCRGVPVLRPFVEEALALAFLLYSPTKASAKGGRDEMDPLPRPGHYRRLWFVAIWRKIPVYRP